MDLKIADLAQDGQILQLARSSAQAILNEDPNLSSPENQLLLNQLQYQAKTRTSWSE